MADAKIDTSTARSSVLAKVRKSLGASTDGPQQKDRDDRVASRLAARAPGIIPTRGAGDNQARTKLLRTMMERADTTVDEVDSLDQIPGAIANYLKDRNLPAQLRMGDDPMLGQAGWESQPLLEINKGRADPTDPVSVSAAVAAVAESGTLILHAGSDNPTTLNFLPETHIVVVRASDIEGDYEAVWAKLRERFGDSVMPRVVNMISGPSRTGDIEQTILLGAHGPKQLHLIIVR